MGQIRVAKSYIDKESVKDLEKAGYTVKLSERGYWTVSAEDETADEITDSLRDNGWSKIDTNLVKGGVNESADMEDFSAGVRDGLTKKNKQKNSSEYLRGYRSGVKQREKAPSRYGESLAEANVSVKVKDKSKLDSVLKAAKKFEVETEVVPLAQSGLSKDGVVVVLTGASEDIGDFISSCKDCVRMKQYRESALDLALAALTEEKQVRIIGFDRDAALGVLNKSKQGHSVVYRMQDGKKQYGIVYGGKTAGWSYL